MICPSLGWTTRWPAPGRQGPGRSRCHPSTWRTAGAPQVLVELIYCRIFSTQGSLFPDSFLYLKRKASLLHSYKTQFTFIPLRRIFGILCRPTYATIPDPGCALMTRPSPGESLVLSPKALLAPSQTVIARSDRTQPTLSCYCGDAEVLLYPARERQDSPGPNLSTSFKNSQLPPLF